jgi:hypothetical protein
MVPFPSFSCEFRGACPYRESRASSHARALRGVQDHILVPKRTWDRIDS